MPVSVIPSAGQTATKQKSTARKRRRNQNVEIDELASLVPLSTPLVPPSESSSGSLVSSNGGKGSAIDKISVLRLTSTFLKLQNFMKDTTPGSRGDREATFDLLKMMEEAMDGFLIVLDKEANILYVSETITGYVGLSQQDVIGQNLSDITHPESAGEITDNLKPAATPPTSMVEESIISQFRQFYVRFRSTVTPSRMQLSRFTSHTMVQVNGNLKVRLPPSSNFGKRDVEAVEPTTIGFVGECRLIESASSILELSVPHSTFTMTKSLDMKIISVESTVKDIVGYDPEDLLSDNVNIVDFFHPADYKRMVPCEKFLMRTGHAVSPHFRFLTSSGDWVWMQLEATLRYKSGTKIPQFWEVKARVLSQDDGKLKYIEQNELYASNPDPDQDLLNPHRDQDIASKLANKSTHCKEEGAKPIIDSLKGTKLPDSILEPVLHARSMALSKIPTDIKPILTMDKADEFVAQRDKAFATMQRNNSMSSIASSPVSSLSPASAIGSLGGGASPAATSVSRGTSTSRNGSLSSTSVASPLSSVSSPPISPPTQLSGAPSPNTPASVRSTDSPLPIGANGQLVNGGSNSMPQMRLASVPGMVTAPSPNTPASVQQMDTSSPLGANGHVNGGINGVPQTKLASVPTAQGHFIQLQRERLGEKIAHMGVQEYNQMFTAPTATTNPVIEDQNGIQSPPSVGSSLSSVSSPPSTTVMPTAQQQGFVSGHFVGNGGSFSETPSPYNSAVSAVSSPPSVFSPDMGGPDTLHTAVSTDSIPSVGSVPFQNFHTLNFIPQAPPTTSDSFNPQIPSNFNFNSATSPYPTTAANLQNSTSFVQNLDTFTPENQMFDSFNPLLNPSDSVMHQLLSDMVVLNSDPNFNATASVPNSTAANMNSNFTHSHPQAPSNYFMPSNSHAPVPPQPPTSSVQGNNTFAMSCDIALTQLNVTNGGRGGVSHLLNDSQTTNSNPEVQDILQQFQ